MYKIIDGKKVANFYLEKIKEEVSSLEKKPHLAVILVGNDVASDIYVKAKQKKALELGMKSSLIKMNENSSESELLSQIDTLNKNPEINAILVQLPLPKQIDTRKIIDAISLFKDVDGFKAENLGRIAQNECPLVYPCTPLGIENLFKYYNINLSGKDVVVLGRS